LVATFSGVMSACFSFGLTAGRPIGDASALAGTATLWTGLPQLVGVLVGGFTTDFILWAVLNLKNRTAYEYLATHVRPGRDDTTDFGNQRGHEAGPDLRVPLVRNYFCSALAGTVWYFQFFFYTMGETQMGRFGFASWTLHM